MNIIVEGPDCAGKSTLVKELKNRLGFDSLALGHKDTNQFRRFLKVYASFDQTIIERGHISEVVYSTVYKRQSPFTAAEQKILDSIVAQTCLVIYARPKLETAIERYTARSNVYQPTKVEELGTCLELFDDYFKDIAVDIKYHSRNFEELETVVAQVQELLK